MSSSVPYLSPAQPQTTLGLPDLSDPGEGPHAIQILVDRVVEALSRAWSCKVRRARSISGLIGARHRVPRERRLARWR